jgi:hypothetical protein
MTPSRHPALARPGLGDRRLRHWHRRRRSALIGFIVTLLAAGAADSVATAKMTFNQKQKFFI